MSKRLEFKIANLGTFALASPCTESWAAMKGTDTVRHCERCDLDVYDARKMTVAELEQRFATGRRVCLRLWVRFDGTLLTKDCPSGVKALVTFARERSQKELRELIIASGGRPPLSRRLWIPVVVAVAVAALGWNLFGDQVRRSFGRSDDALGGVGGENIAYDLNHAQEPELPTWMRTPRALLSLASTPRVARLARRGGLASPPPLGREPREARPRAPEARAQRAGDEGRAIGHPTDGRTSGAARAAVVAQWAA
jgi:hypothetical protein